MNKNINIKRMNICDQPHKNWIEQIYHSYYKDSPHNSKHMFDIYSLTHLFWPMLLTIIGKNIFGDNMIVYIILFILMTAFEIHENMPDSIQKYNRVEVDTSGVSTYRGDSTINIIGDIIFNSIGIYLGYTLSMYWSLFILGLTALIVTKIVGYNYWIDLFNFII